MFGTILDSETADAIWTILVENAGAYEKEREYFIHSVMEGITEYRFCGSLGFGGKFWVDRDRWYVNCYQEDETTSNLEIIGVTNEKLKKLKDV